MDRFLREAITVLFRRTAPDDILRRWQAVESFQSAVPAYRQPDRKDFCQALQHEEPRYSPDEVRNVYLACSRMLAADDRREGVFFLLRYAVQDILVMDSNEECLCKHENLLQFWELAHPVGAPILVAAHHAWFDLRRRSGQRKHFVMNPIVRTDCFPLRAVLREGMAENHFHIGGSSHAFLFSWICLMNHVVGRRKQFVSMDIDRTPLDNLNVTISCKRSSFYVLAIKAAYLRAFLYQRLRGEYLLLWPPQQRNEPSCNTSAQQGASKGSAPRDKEPTSLYDEEKEARRFLELVLGAEDKDCEQFTLPMQSTIDALRYASGRPRTLDYAIEEDEDPRDPNRAYYQLSGEFSLIYRLLYAIYANDPNIMPFADLAYAYLAIWTQMRSELMQTNRRSGFANFQAYQDRKEAFTENYPRYQLARDQMALHAVLDDHRIKSLEVRFIPSDTVHKIRSRIQRYDMLSLSTTRSQMLHNFLVNQRWLDSEDGLKHQELYDSLLRARDHRLHYVLHFAKTRQDNVSRDHMLTHPRDDRLRRKLTHDAEKILRLREHFPDNARALTGIDACSNEIGCRPEVFAITMRRLREHAVVGNRSNGRRGLSKLRLTYHVGEDFLDVLDGMRAIDEAVHFLNMRQGDRLGHAMALGVDVKRWYQGKEYRMLLPAQDLLDNVVWLYGKMQRYGIETHEIEGELQDLFHKQFIQIYRANLPFSEKDHSVDIDTYLTSWELRGDDPYLYLHYANHEQMKKELQGAAPHELRKNQLVKGLPVANLQACYLFHHYHFNPAVRVEGARILEYRISTHMMQAVEQVQKHQQREVAQRNISIECNPTSNYLIGTFKRFDQHPMILLNDVGLLDRPDNPRLSISINTDDMGVFDTCLENEYALMACALEKANETNADGQSVSPQRVYKWLDAIRKMGLDQSFLLSSDSEGDPNNSQIDSYGRSRVDIR